MTVAQEKITRDITIEGMFAKFPHKAQKLATILTKAGLHCVGCSAATWETLESGVLRHGMTEADLEKLLEGLNAVIAEEADLDTITLTKKAAEKFLEILKAEGKVGYGLRFDEQPAGCSGFEYTLDFSEKAEEDDMTIVSNGVNIHINKKMEGRLLGTEIDYVDGLQAGFKISNPNVRHSCGCGNSHGY